MRPGGIRARRAALVVALCAGLLGAPSAAGAYTAAVWNGTRVSPGEHPAVAVIEIGGGRCTGTLVRPRWLLTAAHCLSDVPAAPITVGLDGVKLSEGFGEVHATRLHVVHPRWSFRTGRNDFALVYLPRRSAQPPATLARPDDGALYQVDTPVEIVGWGWTDSFGAGGRVLRAARTSVAANTVCGDIYGGVFSAATMVCGSGTTGDACRGDSGGPMFATSNDRLVQIGVTSFGGDCAFSEGGVYARVAAGRQWIDATIAQGRPARLSTLLSAAQSRTTIGIGRRVVLRGRLARAGDGRGLVAQPVQLLRRRQGTSTWRVVNSQWTQTRGQVRFEDRPRFDAVYKLRHRRGPATAGARSVTLRVAVRR